MDLSRPRRRLALLREIREDLDLHARQAGEAGTWHREASAAVSWALSLLGKVVDRAAEAAEEVGGDAGADDGVIGYYDRLLAQRRPR